MLLSRIQTIGRNGEFQTDGLRSPSCNAWARVLFAALISVSLLFLAAVSPTLGAQSEDEPAAGSEDEDVEDEPLPTIDRMELPAFQRLVKGPAIDWVVLRSKKVIVVEPVVPRPGTLDDMNQKIKKAGRKAGDPPESEAAKQRRLGLYYLPVTLLEGEDREYRLHMQFIKEIIYYEDLMLRRIDQLLDERQVRQAYELIVALEGRQESWPGLAPRKDRLLFTEAAIKLDEKQPQHALALLEALHERKPAFPGLEAQLGQVADRLMALAIDKGDPREARFFLRRLARRYPNHRVATAWTMRLTEATRALLNKAGTLERSGRIEEALDAAEEAARTWPDLPELLPVFNRLAARHQRLRVGVIDLPSADPSDSPVLLADAARRRNWLTQAPLFEPARTVNKNVRYETRFFNEWEPTELGHSVLFRLRPRRMPEESEPLVTAAALAGALAGRIDLQSSRYDARLAAAIESLEVRSAFELLIRFRQAPLRPESLFAFDFLLPGGMGTSFSASDSTPAARDAEKGRTTYPFQLKSAGDQRAKYVRSIPEPERATGQHVAEVIEFRFDSNEKAIQGMLRGDVSLLPRVPASSVRGLSARQEFFTQHYALPTTHVLQFNPRSHALSARTLRRALVYALNRPRILEDVFLGEPLGNLGRLTSAPFATTSYAYNREVQPHKFDPALAFSLAKSAEKELAGKLPVLKLLCAPDPDVQLAAARITSQWKAIGIEALVATAPVAAIPADHSANGPVEWDILYRTETLAEPLTELWPFLALTNSTETTALAHLPTWLRQELLDLDRAGDWGTAGRLLHRLHKQFWAEVHLIPLWEIDDVLVYRKNVRGVPERPMNAYQRIEHWKVEPWFPREPPL